jgi:hypothetical protein
MNLGRLMVFLACLVSTLAYSGSVTLPALWTLVLPATLIVGSAALFAQGLSASALAVVIVSASAVGEIVNVVSGEYQGSVARSTFGGVVLTGLAVLLSGSRRPASFLLPFAGLIAWALALGSGGRVALVAVVSAALAAVALAVVERDARRYVSAPRLAPTLLLVLLLTVLAGVLVARVQLSSDLRQPASPFRSSLVTAVEPPHVLSLTDHAAPDLRVTRPSAFPPESPNAASKREDARVRRVALLALLAFLLVLLAAFILLLVRWLWVQLSWRLFRRRLKRRSTPEAGAWSWVVAVEQRVGDPLPLSASPDVVLNLAPGEPMRELAAQVSQSVFGPQRSRLAADPWLQAALVADEVWAAAGRGGRLRARFRTPERLDPAH